MGKKRTLALIWAVLAALLLTGYGAAAEEAADGECRYYYQLVKEETRQNLYYLYVERTDAGGVPLHAGSIVLGAKQTNWNLSRQTDGRLCRRCTRCRPVRRWMMW